MLQAHQAEGVLGVDLCFFGNELPLRYFFLCLLCMHASMSFSGVFVFEPEVILHSTTALHAVGWCRD